MAAIREKCSNHWDMSVIVSLAGGEGRPGACTRSGSIVISDISRKSSSRILLTILGGRDAAGLNGSFLDKREFVPVSSPVTVVSGAHVVPAAAARRS